MLSVVIPVYNEEVRLRHSLAQVGQYLAELVSGPEASSLDGFEIICSDDGSSDQSAALAEEMADVYPIRLLRSAENMGKGAAVVRGMLAARGDPIFFFDADLSTPLVEIQRFLDVMRREGADVAIGTRKHPEATIERSQPRHRVQMGLAYTRLVHRITRTSFSDYTCGFKAFRQEASAEIFRRSRIRGWSFDAEILFLAQRLGRRVVEVPVRWADEPDSHVRLWRDVARSFLELLAIRYFAWRGRYD